MADGAVNKSAKRAFVFGVAAGAGAADVELEGEAGRAEAPTAKAMTIAFKRVDITTIVY
jgi:hypothetical protein